ncbi:MAG: DUF2304 domain-containing protein [Clostridia bacterium]|nr:DUF2304 domain-containing protein [Clostridia bacterium]
MSIRLRILILFICIAILVYFVDIIRKDKITLKYSLPWLAALTGVMLTAVFPGFINWVAQLLGIATPVNAIFFIVIMMMLMFIFLTSVISSRNAQRVTRLVQEVALLKKALADQEEKGPRDKEHICGI